MDPEIVYPRKNRTIMFLAELFDVVWLPVGEVGVPFDGWGVHSAYSFGCGLLHRDTPRAF